MTLEIKLLALDAVKLATDDTSGTVQGYASVFGGVDSYRDTVIPGAYARTLSEWKARGYPLPMIDEHWGATIGKWTDMEEDSVGLRVKGELTPGHSRANDVLASLRHKAVTGLSIGYRVREAEATADGRRVLKDIDLSEISIVTMPADDRARVDGVKAIPDIETLADAERWLRDAAGRCSRKDSLAFVTRVKSIALRDAEAERQHAAWLADIRRRTSSLITA